jgi:hypothetical protein
MGLRGPKPKGALHHIMRGNYRPSRHGPRPETPKDDDWIKTAWAILRESAGIPAPEPRPLDPIEELLQRDGIEVTQEDKKPKLSR